MNSLIDDIEKDILKNYNNTRGPYVFNYHGTFIDSFYNCTKKKKTKEIKAILYEEYDIKEKTGEKKLYALINLMCVADECMYDNFYHKFIHSGLRTFFRENLENYLWEKTFIYKKRDFLKNTPVNMKSGIMNR